MPYSLNLAGGLDLGPLLTLKKGAYFGVGPGTRGSPQGGVLRRHWPLVSVLRGGKADVRSSSGSEDHGLFELGRKVEAPSEVLLSGLIFLSAHPERVGGIRGGSLGRDLPHKDSLLAPRSQKLGCDVWLDSEVSYQRCNSPAATGGPISS